MQKWQGGGQGIREVGNVGSGAGRRKAGTLTGGRSGWWEMNAKSGGLGGGYLS